MFIANFINILFEVIIWAIIGRILISWVNPQGSWAISRILHDVTEPILAPVRRILPSMGMLDLSPMIVLILLQVIKSVVLGSL